MLNEHPLKIRINTIEDMFKQIEILGNNEVNKYKKKDVEISSYYYWSETEFNSRVNRRLGEIYIQPNKEIELLIYIWMTGEIIIVINYWNEQKQDFDKKYQHLGKFFTKKQMNELKNYMIQHYDKDEFGDYKMKELAYKEA